MSIWVLHFIELLNEIFLISAKILNYVTYIVEQHPLPLCGKVILDWVRHLRKKMISEYSNTARNKSLHLAD